MIPEEEIKEMYDAMILEQQQREKKWNKDKKSLKGLIHPRYFDFAEDHESFFSEGIVEIEKTDEKRSGYPKHECCRIKGKQSNLYMYHKTDLETIDGNSKYEDEEIEYWVWQTTGYAEDDYSGYLLLPMLDGRYWMVAYSC